MKPTAKKTTNYWLKFSIIFWILILTPGITITLLMFLVSNDYLGSLPKFEELENPKSNLATVIYSADGKELGKYFSENRTNVKYADLSPYLPQALVATEDERFRNHSGVDAKGLIRAVAFLGKKGGASTITQQLSKMLFHKRPTNKILRILQKLKEWVIAARLERQYTKDEIIMMYFNKLDFVNNAVGIKSAANVYFDKHPSELLVEESAMLVGMAKNPSLFNPVKRPDTTLHRRNVVLKQMYKNDFITKSEFDSLKLIPLQLNYQIVDHKEGLAPYFREVLRSELTDLFRKRDPETGEYIYKKIDGSNFDIYKDGLKIYTTIDSRMQKYAEFAVTEHLKSELQNDFFRDLNRRGANKPFDNQLTPKQVNDILWTSIKRTQKYQVLVGNECANCGRRGKFVDKEKINGVNYFVCNAEDCLHQTRATSPDSIEIIFNTPKPMKIFSWQGEIDTLLSPIDSIKYYKSILRAGLLSIDPHTGYIKAWVGGIDYKHFKYDQVKQGKRQVGSTFKPFIYALAIQEGYSPCYMMPNSPVVFEKEKWGMEQNWSPKNSDGLYGCDVTLKYALANSMNSITAGLLKKFGPNAPKQVIALARKMGITSHLDPVPSLVLGVADISLYELVGANATFANKGVWTEPTYITRIEDMHGNVIVDFIPETREAMSEETAYIMLEMMKGVITGAYNECLGDKMKKIREEKGQGTVCYNCGTGVRLRMDVESRKYDNIKYPVAGKTGTTQNNSDGWFMGITRDLVTGVWVGAEDRSIRFSRTSLGQGANTALPIWGYYMNKVYNDTNLNISKEDFEKPSKKLSVELNCDKARIMKENTIFNSENENFGDDE
jgi:penicillin-binding protein 1A